MLAAIAGHPAQAPAEGPRPVHLVAPRPARLASVSPTASGRAPTIYARLTSDELVHQALQLDFAGRHLEAERAVVALRAQDPADPLGALIAVEHAFWPQLYDVGAVKDDPTLTGAIEEAVRLARANAEANPKDPMAQALYGRALLHDARRLALDGYLIRAGSTSENARKILESAVRQLPGDDDSRYLLGNYYYWAGVMPAYFKYISWLWFVPHGDRDAGVDMLRQVGAGDSLYADSARVMLSVIGSHHAPTNYDEAIDLLGPLHERYPSNVLIHHELVDVLFKAGRYDDMLSQVDGMSQRAAEAQPIRAYGLVADLWRARVALHRGHPDEAERFLNLMNGNTADLPNWTPAWIDVVRGQSHDMRGDRKGALTFYERTLARKGLSESRRASRMAEAGRKAPFDPRVFEHPLLLTGD